MQWRAHASGTGFLDDASGKRLIMDRAVPIASDGESEWFAAISSEVTTGAPQKSKMPFSIWICIA